jgi:hypothetical protein
MLFMIRKSFFLLPLAAVFGSTAVLSAQNVPLPTPNFELYGGYSYVFSGNDNFNTNQIVTSGAPGWDTSFKIPILGSFLGIKADASGSYLKNETPNFSPKQYFFMAGPQVAFHFGRSTLFAHGLVGSSHLTQDVVPSFNPGTSIAIAAGGGLDAGFSRHWAWRVTGDFYNTNFKVPKSANGQVNTISNSNGRVSSGPVFRF